MYVNVLELCYFVILDPDTDTDDGKAYTHRETDTNAAAAAAVSGYDSHCKCAALFWTPAILRLIHFFSCLPSHTSADSGTALSVPHPPSHFLPLLQQRQMDRFPLPEMNDRPNGRACPRKDTCARGRQDGRGWCLCLCVVGELVRPSPDSIIRSCQGAGGGSPVSSAQRSSCL